MATPQAYKKVKEYLIIDRLQQHLTKGKNWAGWPNVKRWYMQFQAGGIHDFPQVVFRVKKRYIDSGIKKQTPRVDVSLRIVDLNETRVEEVADWFRTIEHELKRYLISNPHLAQLIPDGAMFTADPPEDELVTRIHLVDVGEPVFNQAGFHWMDLQLVAEYEEPMEFLIAQGWEVEYFP